MHACARLSGMHLPRGLSSFAAILAVLLASPWLAADTPPLLARALEQWGTGRGDLAFTQHTRVFRDDGQVKEERLERYDPSLPDSQRWRLIEWAGKPATAEQREKWEAKKNGRPRKKAIKPPAEYLDLDHATLVDENAKAARFEVNFRAEAARLIAVEKIAVRITVDKETATIAHISGLLKEPLKVALGLAKITDIDLDLWIEPGDDASQESSGEVKSGSTARVLMSKFGDPMEFKWSDFNRVTAFPRDKGKSQTRDKTS